MHVYSGEPLYRADILDLAILQGLISMEQYAPTFGKHYGLSLMPAIKTKLCVMGLGAKHESKDRHYEQPVCTQMIAALNARTCKLGKSGASAPTVICGSQNIVQRISRTHDMHWCTI